MFDSAFWFCFVVVKVIDSGYKDGDKFDTQIGSVDSAGETPSYISNLEVKSCCGEGSARGTECENSKMLPFLYKKPSY